MTALRNGRDQNFQVALAELPDAKRPESEETSSNRVPAIVATRSLD